MRLLSLRDLSLLDAPFFSSLQIVAYALQAIWACQWQFLLHDTPFTTTYVFAYAECLIYRSDSIIAPSVTVSRMCDL